MIVDGGFDTDQLQREYAMQPNSINLSHKNPVLLTGLLIAFSTLMIAVIGALIMINRQQPIALSPPLQAQAEVQQAQAQLDTLTYQVVENTTRTDLNPVIASNPGILQKFLLNASTALNQRIVAEKEKSGKHEAEITQGVVANAAQKLSLSAAGQKAELRYKNAEGKDVVEIIYPDELGAIAQLKLIQVKYSSRPTQQRFDTVEIARESLANEKALNCAKAKLTLIQGLSEVAKTLTSTDIFGRPIDPSNQSDVCLTSNGGVQ